MEKSQETKPQVFSRDVDEFGSTITFLSGVMMGYIGGMIAEGAIKGVNIPREALIPAGVALIVAGLKLRNKGKEMASKRTLVDVEIGDLTDVFIEFLTNNTDVDSEKIDERLHELYKKEKERKKILICQILLYFGGTYVIGLGAGFAGRGAIRVENFMLP